MTELTLTSFLQDWQTWAERYLAQGLSTPARHSLQFVRHWQTQAELLGFSDLASLAAQLTDHTISSKQQAQVFQQLIMKMHLLKRQAAGLQLASMVKDMSTEP
ncbi:hypothetical protein [Photobacterium galatheae]|uniref:Uncharacterized protein n=1 Tax=Photobacterium galatheae TaxID=1654360 RepID=A0A066RIP5_9GAMM|nr:hypothetical protein [Photobacterium galatheae]KDM90315.1 hypothetical protein EA58_17620 [Photobacterium galatheae]MCM0150804.1 hypothetical protein [Photobacterium galatheae]